MVNGTSRSRTSSKTNKIMKKPRKNKFVMRLSQIMFVSFFGVAGFTGLNFKKTVNLQIDATQKQVSTTAATVEQLLKDQGIEKDKYHIITNDDKIDSDETIVLSSQKQIILSLGGETKNVTTYALTFGEFLAEQKIELGENNVLTTPKVQNAADFLDQYKEVKIDTVTKEQKQVTVTKDLPEQTVETDELIKGQVEVVPGEPKIITETYEISKTNGIETANVKISETVVKEGKAAIKKVGKKTLTKEMSEAKKNLMKQAGISEADYEYVNYIIQHESNWDIGATNASSGAYGLPQSLPGSKMASEGSDWKTNPVTQLKWADKYAKSRYGGWKQAYDYWLANKVW